MVINLQKPRDNPGICGQRWMIWCSCLMHCQQWKGVTTDGCQQPQDNYPRLKKNLKGKRHILGALAQDLGSIPGTHIVAHNHL